MNREDKIKKLKRNMEESTEREMRQIEKRERRERRPGEKEKLKRSWESSANRIHNTKLHEVFNQ